MRLSQDIEIARAYTRVFLNSLKPWTTAHRVHRSLKANAILVGGQPTPTPKSRAGNGDKAA